MWNGFVDRRVFLWGLYLCGVRWWRERIRWGWSWVERQKMQRKGGFVSLQPVFEDPVQDQKRSYSDCLHVAQVHSSCLFLSSASSVVFLTPREGRSILPEVPSSTQAVSSSLIGCGGGVFSSTFGRMREISGCFCLVVGVLVVVFFGVIRAKAWCVRRCLGKEVDFEREGKKISVTRASFGGEVASV